MWIHIYSIWKMNLNSKNDRKTSFSHETKDPKSFTPIRRMWLWCPMMKKKRLLSKSMFTPIERQTWIPKMVEREVFLTKPKRQNHLSQQVESDYSAQSWIKRRLLRESTFIPIERQTSIRKMLEREVFLIKPKHQNHLSQWGECDYAA